MSCPSCLPAPLLHLRLSYSSQDSVPLCLCCCLSGLLLTLSLPRPLLPWVLSPTLISSFTHSSLTEFSHHSGVLAGRWSPLVTVCLSFFCLPVSVTLFTSAVCVPMYCLSVAASRVLSLAPWGTHRYLCFSKSRTQFSSKLSALSTKSFVTFVIRKSKQTSPPSPP